MMKAYLIQMNNTVVPFYLKVDGKKKDGELIFNWTTTVTDATVFYTKGLDLLLKDLHFLGLFFSETGMRKSFIVRHISHYTLCAKGVGIFLAKPQDDSFVINSPYDIYNNVSGTNPAMFGSAKDAKAFIKKHIAKHMREKIVLFPHLI